MTDFDKAIFGILGEAIIDLLPAESGNLKPAPGGSPYNVARALGKQSMPVGYLSPLSTDQLGSLLKNRLIADGGSINEDLRSSLPTSLAVVQLDQDGIPSYSLYRSGIADREYNAKTILDNIPPTLQLFHTGSLAVIPEDIPKVIDILDGLKSRQILISVDFNFRPNIVNHHDEYVRSLEKLVPYCDILKASDEDLQLMGYSQGFDELAHSFLSQMQNGIVAFTLGEKGAHIYSDKYHADFKGFAIEDVVDTVGAGDSFQAGMLSAFQQKYALDKNKIASASAKDLEQILHWACACAAINVTRQGCNPPTSEEVSEFLKGRGNLF